jgi:hypothetical protein
MRNLRPLYVLSPAPKSKCPDCDGTVELLMKKSLGLGPIFYVCWTCKKLFEAGRGPVERENVL